MQRWRGLKAVVVDAVEHGSRAIEHLQKETAKRPFAILEQIPGTTRTHERIHPAPTPSSRPRGERAAAKTAAASAWLTVPVPFEHEALRAGAQRPPQFGAGGR